MDKSWYAISVRSRHEFVTESELLKRGIETFLPRIKRLRLWRDRRKTIDFPLFPGYMFVCISPWPEEFLRVLRIRGVVNLLCAEKGQPTSVPDEEINFLKILVESREDLNIYPHIKEGTRVLMLRGPLKGAKGTVVRKDGQHMLFVGIYLLGRSIGVKVYTDDVEVA